MIMTDFKLQILHASDQLADAEALDDAPRFSSVINGLRAQYPEQTLTLASGNMYVPGPFFFAAGDPAFRQIMSKEGVGRGDIAINNAMGFDAVALGTHEFDLGTGVLASLLPADPFNPNVLYSYPGTLFPLLSSNLDFSTDRNLAPFVVPDGQAPQGNKITGSVVVEKQGERIGIIGVTTPLLGTVSSPGNVGISPGEPNDLNALAATIQTSVNELTADGINKIVLLSHMRDLSIEEQLASRLQNVDVIIAGGSNTLLADESDRLRTGDTAQGVYPIIHNSLTGEPVAVVNTKGNYKYVGRLVVDFDENGRIIPNSIDPNISGAFPTDELGVTETGNAPPHPLMLPGINFAKAVIAPKDGNIFGQTEVFLNGETREVRTQETNLGNLSADANLFVARQVDHTAVISLRNSGSVRASIGAIGPAGEELPPRPNPPVGKEEGEVSQLDIQNVLRFNNQLTLVTITAAQLRQVLEHSLAGVSPGATPGSFPQVGGFKFSFDATRPVNDRVRSLVIVNDRGNPQDVVIHNGQVVGDPNRTFRMVTLNFLAGGGDGYPFSGFAAANPSLFNRVDLQGGQGNFAPFGSEQYALAEYLAATFPNANQSFNQADTEPALDQRIQNLAFRNDGLTSFEINGISGRDNLTGTFLNDTLVGFQGRDTIATGAGSDVIVYNGLADGGDIITDFEVGSDRLDLARVLRGIGYVASNPLGDGYVGFIPTGANTLLTIDADGSAGPGVARSFILLQAVTPTQLNNPSNFIFA